MLIRVFAVIGVYAVCKTGYQLYDKHVRRGVERIIADAMADEQGRSK